MKQKVGNESIHDVLERMLLVFSPKYGLANSLIIEEMVHKKIKRPNCGTFTLGNVIPMYRTTVESSKVPWIIGCGAALTKEKSQIKAFGEFIERYCATNYMNDHNIKLYYNTFEEQSKCGDCLNPRELIDFNDNANLRNGSEFSVYSDDSMVSWIIGTEETEGKTVWIPAQKVFLGMPFINGEQMYMQLISTGLACGSTYYDAMLGSLYEVIERDSFMLTWLLRLPSKRIVVDSFKNRELQELYSHITNNLVGEDELLIYDISQTDGIYTILTFIRNSNLSSFGLITSSAADIDPECALLKSLEELCLTQGYAYYILCENEDAKDSIAEMKVSDVTSLGNHIKYYGTGNRSDEFDFLDVTNASINLSDMCRCQTLLDKKESALYVIELLKKQNLSVFTVDVTRQEIMECGLFTIKTIIPGYNDLDNSHNSRLIANKRLLDLKKKYNVSINNAPHPFP